MVIQPVNQLAIPNHECDLIGFTGVRRWRSGENTLLPPVRPRFDPRIRCHMWVEFVVCSHPCSKRLFTGSPLYSKTNISKFQFDPESQGDRFVSRNILLSVILVKKKEVKRENLIHLPIYSVIDSEYRKVLNSHCLHFKNTDVLD